ncbi:MAG: NAD(P)/FAD-dependent oxidoreductase [Dehalococcoidales bacterium]|nr:NAD(P)/FAD-dependent oxidoreductase [Dehalococcoidales bacterium]
MMEKSIIIIGGGLAGLSTGCYGRMNGYKTTIFEMHDIAGGVCTAWKRKDYTIDGAMNWLVGTRPGSQFHNFWEELGAAQEWKIHNHDHYLIREDKEGKAFTMYCNADRFEKYLLELAPEDSDVIKEFTQAIRTSSDLSMPVEKPVELMGPADQAQMAQMLPGMQFMQKWAEVSTHDFAQRLKNSYLREVFLKLPELPMIMFVMVLGLQHAQSAGYVIGGALALVESIEKRYRDLGGEIHFNSRVVKIIVEDNKAAGVILDNGQEYRADYIVSAGDGRTTIFDLLGGKYIDEKIKNIYDQPKLFAPLVHVGLGVDRTFNDIPSSVGGLSFPLDKPVRIAGKEEKDLNVFIYNFDPTLAPQGKTLVTVYYETDYDYWHALRQDIAGYNAEKERIADEVIAGLEQRFPGISGQIEMRSVATPITWERYTGNWRGAYEGWIFGAYDNVSKTLPGLDNFYMAGQWVNPGGGMPPAVMSGNHTIQFICQKDNKQFITSKP